MADRPVLLTFGHGRLDRAEFAALVTGAGIELVVDVRRFPGSRTNEASSRGEIPLTLAEARVGYRWDPRLGGRRTLTKADRAASPDSWWKVEAFRAYAAWTRSAEFRSALPELLSDIAATRTAIMCSEAVWWRCHRRMIADVMMLEFGVDVLDLMHDGRLLPHEVSGGARLDHDGLVVWDAGHVRQPSS